MSVSWTEVAKAIRRIVDAETAGPPNQRVLDDGQCASLLWMADRLPHSGLVLADEVGTGKTRIACAVVRAVIEVGGRAAIVVPHGLMHQWQHEAQVLGMDAGKPFTSLGDFIKEAESKLDGVEEKAMPNAWRKIAPAPGQREWLLISHGFRAPQVRQAGSPAEWRVALPSYVRAELTRRSERKDRRTIVGKLLAQSHRTTQRIAADIGERVRGHERRNERRLLRERLEQLPFYRRRRRNALLIEKLQGDGREVVEELLGLWFGELDLIVIDEAHKSRGEVGGDDRVVSGSVLSRLVTKLLKQPETGRRLCLTATPMELDLEQWLHLLGPERANCGLDGEKSKSVVEEFRTATREAAIAPDEPLRLERLKKAANEFETMLSPYVTRRRRDEAELIRKFRDRREDSSRTRPHPHRRVEKLSVHWTARVGDDPRWRDVLFAAECMRQSALGLECDLFERALQSSLAKTNGENGQTGLAHRIRSLSTRIASGHLSVDVWDEDLQIVPPSDCAETPRGKIERTEHWRRRIQRTMKDGLDEAEHPRIVAAVREIERWTVERNEKVLVFGVFLRPLRHLRDVLNLRAALRAADQERPVAHVVVDADSQLPARVRRQLELLRAEGALSKRLKGADDDDDVKEALLDSHEKYLRDRRRIERRVQVVLEDWKQRFRLLDGDVEDVLEGLRRHLVAFVIDEQMLSPTPLESPEVRELAAHFWDRHVTPELSETELDDESDEVGDGHLEQLRRIFCEDDNLRMRTHAVLLSGQDRWSTRRYVQAAFNRPSSSPRVLIAQSQVGREGLNLHESCRVVVQFHAEWNPAVLEQQIGRVDRKGSLWEKRARDWLQIGVRDEEPPFIEVRQLVFEGTYDEFQWDCVSDRQLVFDASLFGSLLPGEAMQRVPKEHLQELLEAAPSFRPPELVTWPGPSRTE